MLKAAVVAFSERGFDGAITRDIAAAAGVSHSLLLYHFKSKGVLWQEAIVSLRRDYSFDAEVVLRSMKDVSATRRLWELIKLFVEFSCRKPEFHRMMLFEARTRNERLQWMLSTYLRDAHERMMGLLADAQKEGGVKQGDLVRLRYAVIALATLPISISAHYHALTRRDISSQKETAITLELIRSLVFTGDPESTA